MRACTFLCLPVIGLALLWAALPAAAVEYVIVPGGQQVFPPGLDSPQPDTISYDTGGNLYLPNAQNYWGIVRFTAPSDFELRCIYIQMWNINNQPDGVNVAILNDNGFGQPGTVVSGPVHLNGPLWYPPFSWADVELPQPFPNFAAAENFFVVFGPTGPTTQGWYLMIDGTGNTENRSGFSTSSSGPWQFTLSGDLIVRAGGEVTTTFVDLGVNSCFNDVQQFFLSPGVPVRYRAEVKNFGNEDALTFRVVWKVLNAGGMEVFADSADFGTLAAGATATVDCPSLWTTGAAGYYKAQATVVYPGEQNPGNNTNYLEQGIGDFGTFWYKYDDDQANTNISATPGFGWGNGFIPQQYPVKVDSVQIGIAGAIATSEVPIVNFVGSTMTTLYTYTGPMVAGMNTINLTGADINVFSGSIGVGYVYQNGGAIYKDSDPPLAASNARMPAMSYEIAQGVWTAESSGDYMIRLFCSESSALPPYPVIRIEPDTLDFGMVEVGVPTDMSFWVYNDGGANLNVTNILIPPLFTGQLVLSTTSFVVASLGSQEVVATWTPAAEGTISGSLGIMNNATTPYPEFLPIRGTGFVLGIIPRDELIPAEYSLQGNFPNPFNNSTRFTFSLPVGSRVTLKVYDVQGQEVAVLVNDWMNAGSYDAVFNASDLPSGVYVYRLNAGTFSAGGKMVLLK